ncbi:hypothetical protein [Pseudomonas aeruginosa]|uniref:hypothetical protein n=1 Tax=Pseudomonas aeruginosa TaxID=287 RepID=UPI00068D79AE|nr:hypothetical protein [Pseudomonas aeruginosa]
MSERYRVEQTGKGFWPYCVRAGNGTRDLYVGHKKTCDRVAAELTTAFRDGEFVGKGLYDALAAEAQALREEVAKLTQYNKSLDDENTRLLADCEKTDKEVAALRTKLAMAEDAAAKGDAARQQCGGMEMEIQELREQAAKLAAFAQEIISGALEGGSFDGADIQESAERHGLIAKQMMREPCRGPEEYCACAWSTSFPTECYRITAEIRALLNQDKENGNG